MTPMTKRELLKAAKHEAGHAVCAMMMRCQFGYIQIGDGIDTDADFNELAFGKEASGVITLTGGDMNNRAFVITLMGGLAGVRVNCKKPGKVTFTDILGGVESDWREAKALAPSILDKGMTVDEYINNCLTCAHKLITMRKHHHAAIVKALVAKGKLTYEECVSVIREVSTRRSGPLRQRHSKGERQNVGTAVLCRARSNDGAR